MNMGRFDRIQALRNPRLVMVRDHSSTRLTATVGAAALAMAGVLLATSSVQGTSLSWNNVAGGSAATSTNWSPVQVPVSADDLTYNLLATYTVTLPVGTASSNSHTYKRGSVTLNITSPHTIGAGALRVGDVNLDSATMTLTTGTLNCNASVFIGDDAGSTGVLNVNDVDADLIIAGATSDLFVGSNGPGTLNITGRGLVSVADQFIAGNNAAATSNVTVSGALAVPPFGVSTLNVLGSTESRIGQGGDATMTISNGGVADFASDVIIANGSASTSSVTVQTVGLLNARLDVGGDLSIGRNNSGVAAGIGTVTADTGGSVLVAGTLFVGGDLNGGTGNLLVNNLGIVVANDINVGLNGNMQLGGGFVNTTLGITNDSTGLIQGFGTINSDIFNSGPIQPQTAAGLTIDGILHNTTSNQIVGSKIHFGPNGGYEGSGTCQADITGDAASHITATGALTIGANTATGYFYLGALDVGFQDVTLSDSNGAVLGGLTRITSGGQLACAAGIGVQNGGTIQGEGDLVGNLTVAGVIDPKDPNRSLGGLISVQGNLIMNPSGVFDMLVNSDPPNQSSNDRMNVSGTATFGGTLRLHIRPGFIPNTGNQFIAINATQGRTGVFDSIVVEGPLPCNGVTFVLVYSSTAVIVLIRPPDADVNQDNVVNIDDLVQIITHWGEASALGNGVDPVDIDDLVLVITHWGCQGN